MIDYGIDAPGLRRGMAVLGLLGIGVAAGAARIAPVLPPDVRVGAIGLGGLAGTYGLFMAAYMTYSSRIGKLRERDRLLGAIGEVRPWRGDESVLDVGCGRGLMLVGCAQRLVAGTAVGVDLWRAEDQSGNSPEAARENARRAGVADRVRIETADARRLPFDDASFDVVVSHWTVHNVGDSAERRTALDELWRCARPGGVVLVADIAHVEDARRRFEAAGAVRVQFFDGGFEARAMSVLSGGSYTPQAVLAVKPPVGP